MRAVFLVCLICAVGACRDGGDDSTYRPRPGDPAFTSSSGEVSLTDGETLEFTITSERYKAWDVARQGLDSRIASRYGAILQPGSPSRRNIDRAVAYLESEPAAKASIERSGMSVRDFVVTTVALEQEMRLASARGEVPPDTVIPPYPVYTPYPVDTTTYMPTPYAPLPPPVPVTRQYLDTFPRPDTAYALPPRRDSVALPPPDTSAARRFPIADSIARAAARRDSARKVDSIKPRDSVVTRRDTIVTPRPSVPPPPPPDTARDTLAAKAARRG